MKWKVEDYLSKIDRLKLEYGAVTLFLTVFINMISMICYVTYSFSILGLIAAIVLNALLILLLIVIDVSDNIVTSAKLCTIFFVDMLIILINNLGKYTGIIDKIKLAAQSYDSTMFVLAFIMVVAGISILIAKKYLVGYMFLVVGFSVFVFPRWSFVLKMIVYLGFISFLWADVLSSPKNENPVGLRGLAHIRVMMHILYIIFLFVAVAYFAAERNGGRWVNFENLILIFRLKRVIIPVGLSVGVLIAVVVTYVNRRNILIKQSQASLGFISERKKVEDSSNISILNYIIDTDAMMLLSVVLKILMLFVITNRYSIVSIPLYILFCIAVKKIITDQYSDLCMYERLAYIIFIFLIIVIFNIAFSTGLVLFSVGFFIIVRREQKRFADRMKLIKIVNNENNVKQAENLKAEEMVLTTYNYGWDFKKNVEFAFKKWLLSKGSFYRFVVYIGILSILALCSTKIHTGGTVYNTNVWLGMIGLPSIPYLISIVMITVVVIIALKIYDIKTYSGIGVSNWYKGTVIVLYIVIAFSIVNLGNIKGITIGKIGKSDDVTVYSSKETANVKVIQSVIGESNIALGIVRDTSTSSRYNIYEGKSPTYDVIGRKCIIAIDENNCGTISTRWRPMFLYKWMEDTM